MSNISVLVLKPDRRIKKENKSTFVEWIYDENQQSGWFVLRRLFAFMKYFKGGVGLVIDSGYSIPLNPYSSYTDEELKSLTDLDKRAEQAMIIVEGQSEKDNRQNIIARGITFAISGLVIVVVILVIMVAIGRIG